MSLHPVLTAPHTGRSSPGSFRLRSLPVEDCSPGLFTNAGGGTLDWFCCLDSRPVKAILPGLLPRSHTPRQVLHFLFGRGSQLACSLARPMWFLRSTPLKEFRGISGEAATPNRVLVDHLLTEAYSLLLFHLATGGSLNQSSERPVGKTPCYTPSAALCRHSFLV